MEGKRKRVKRILVTPFQRFLATESAGGIMLIFCTLLALVWANSGWSESYVTLWTSKLTIGYGDWQLSKALILWVNDGLMAIFFFLIGLEIKREFLVGELSSSREAALPVIAAIGGAIVPAGLFLLLQGDQPGAEGWGIPMATDIAFSLGILSLLGSRVPLIMKIFLTAFAIVDDILAVLVIAFFYSGTIYFNALFIALGLLGVLLVLNFMKVKNITPYILISIVIWYFFLKSGLHPTLAGILAAFCIPLAARVSPANFESEIEAGLQDFNAAPGEFESVLNYQRLNAVEAIRWTANQVQPPLQRLEHGLHSFVAFFILPVFAIANSGVLLDNIGASLTSSLTISIAVGLLVGKVVGIGFFSWLGLRLNLLTLPLGLSFRRLLAVGMLGGVGFTMSLFIANLAFSDPELLNQAKAGILLGSTLAGLGGYFWLRTLLSKPG